jgi:hypothetical protein
MCRISCLVLCAAAACQGAPAGRSVAALQALDLASFISADEALARAAGQVPDGIAVAVNLEVEDDDEQEPAAWEVSYFVPGRNQIVDVEIDAVSGAVLEVEVEEDGPDDDEGAR